MINSGYEIGIVDTRSVSCEADGPVGNTKCYNEGCIRYRDIDRLYAAYHCVKICGRHVYA